MIPHHLVCVHCPDMTPCKIWSLYLQKCSNYANFSIIWYSKVWFGYILVFIWYCSSSLGVCPLSRYVTMKKSGAYTFKNDRVISILVFLAHGGSMRMQWCLHEVLWGTHEVSLSFHEVLPVLHSSALILHPWVSEWVSQSVSQWRT